LHLSVYPPIGLLVQVQQQLVVEEEEVDHPSLRRLDLVGGVVEGAHLMWVVRGEVVVRLSLVREEVVERSMKVREEVVGRSMKARVVEEVR
jgi:hypothetical protein